MFLLKDRHYDVIENDYLHRLMEVLCRLDAAKPAILKAPYQSKIGADISISAL